VGRTYALLLFLVLGFCPHDAVGAQRTKKIEPAVTPVLPAEQAWMVSLPFPPSAGAAMDEVRAYIPLEGERFIAIDRETGATVWMVDIESAWPPLVHEGTVFLAASDELHALDAATGNHKWRVPLGRGAPGRGAMAPMALVENVLIVLMEPDEVWAFRESSGEGLWVQALGGRAGRVSMAVSATGVFVALVDRLVHVRVADGSVRWDRSLPGQLTSTSVARDRVFVGSTSNEIFAFDTDSGSLEWKFRFGGDVIGIAATDDLVFVASLDNVLRALRRTTGNQLWKRALITRPAAPPLTFEGVVAVAGVESVATFDSRTGMPIGKFDAPNLLQGLPLVDSTPAPFAVSIAVVMRDGQAIGLRPEGMMFREKAVTPVTTLFGRPLQKETLPLR
jgi:outer membrane protein assembly factor BamB